MKSDQTIKKLVMGRMVTKSTLSGFPVGVINNGEKSSMYPMFNLEE